MYVHHLAFEGKLLYLPSLCIAELFLTTYHTAKKFKGLQLKFQNFGKFCP